MSRRFSRWRYYSEIRRAVVALCILLLATGAYLFGTEYWPDKPPLRYDQAVGTEADYLRKHLDADCAALLASPPVPDPTPKQTDDCADKAEAQKYNHASLAQAIRSANATVYSAYIGYLQTCIGIIGAILVTATLTASAVATWAAHNAARGTIDAARATRNSVDLTRRQFALTHRPRIRVRNVVIRPAAEGEPVVVEAEIVNVGDNNAMIAHIRYRIEKRTPAGNVLWHGGAVNEHTGEDGVTRNVLYPINAGSRIVVALQTNVKRNAYEFATPSAFVVVGWVDYRDTYDIESLDIDAMQKFKSVERRTGFERIFRRQTTSGYLRFVRAKEPDPEREHED